MKFWDRIKTAAWILLATEKAQDREVASAFAESSEALYQAFAPEFSAAREETPKEENPFMGQALAEEVYDLLEDSLYALWPLLNANERGGVYAARGLVYGILYTFTEDENVTDQQGIAFELARLVRDWMPEDMEPENMYGVEASDPESMFQETSANPYTGQPELLAFMDAALMENLEGAARVTKAVAERLGGRLYSDKPEDHEDPAEASKLVAVNFMGSVLASASAQFGQMLAADDDDED